MKVLIIHPEFYTYGGAERVIVKLANYLTKKNVQNTLLTTAIPWDIIQDLKDTRLIISPSKDSLMIREILHQIIKDYDILNSHNHPTELLLYPIKRPHVWQCNEPPLNALLGSKIDDREVEIVKRNVSRICVADKFNTDRIKDLYTLDSTIIPYGIDYEFFSSKGNTEMIKDKYGLEDSFVLTQVGMLTITKNQKRTVEIFRNLKDKIPNLKLLLVGYDNLLYADEIRNMIKINHLEDDIKITGAVSLEEIRDIYWTSDIILQPIKSQGGWLSTFEAMCANRLVIGSKEMTVADILQANKLAIVTDDFEKAILDYYKNPDKDRTDAGRWVQKNLSWDKYCQGMLKVFSEVLDESRLD